MSKEAQEVLDAVGAMAEMVYTFYKSLLDCGMDESHATQAVCAFVNAMWMNIGEAARRKNDGT